MPEDLELSATFKDHFSTQSDRYREFRPTYPDALFLYLKSLLPQGDSAWDCATGNGQAAVALARHFRSVVATDASQAQIEAAVAQEGVTYSVAPAEDSGLAENSVDLVTVGQAFHWFDEALFLDEVRRVLRPSGVIAVWCYQLSTVNERCDRIVAYLYGELVDEYWPPEREKVAAGYPGLVLPGTPVKAPPFKLQQRWCVEDMLGYLRTWSACKRFMVKRGSDPVAEIEPELRAEWGHESRDVQWPLQLRVSRVH